MSLPHRFPFRFIDPPKGITAVGNARLGLSVDDAIHRGAGRGAYPSILLLEVLAQAALGTPSEEEDGVERIGYLGGIENALFSPALVERPLSAGDLLDAAVEQRGAFGRTLKVHGQLHRGGELLVEADLILVMAPKGT